MDDPSLHELAPSESSLLTQTRIQRQLTVEQAAASAGIDSEQAQWLEEGRLYRFADADAAIAATIAYAGALGLLAESARRSATRDESRLRRPQRRRNVLAAAAIVATGIAVAVATATIGRSGSTETPATGVAAGVAAGVTAAGSDAPAPRQIVVDTLDAAGRPAAARALAQRLQRLGYRPGRVSGAGRSDEPDSAVYFEPGGAAAGARLARALGLPARPLPGGSDPRRLVVVIGRSGLGAGPG